MIEQPKFTLENTLKKQTKMIEDQGRKQINAATNQSKELVTLTYKDDHKDNYKEIFEDPVKEIFDEIKRNNLMYYF